MVGGRTSIHAMMADALSPPASVATRDDPEARLAGLFDAHHQRLYRLARRLSSSADDARDLVQDTYLRAAQKVGAVPTGASSEEAWLVRVLINICRDRWRQSTVRRRRQHYVHDRATAVPSGEAAMLARATVWQALQRLSPRRRAILVMCDLEGLSMPSVAKLLSLADVTVRWHLSIGRRELAAAIKEGSTP